LPVQLGLRLGALLRLVRFAWFSFTRLRCCALTCFWFCVCGVLRSPVAWFGPLLPVTFFRLRLPWLRTFSVCNNPLHPYRFALFPVGRLRWLIGFRFFSSRLRVGLFVAGGRKALVFVRLRYALTPSSVAFIVQPVCYSLLFPFGSCTP